MKTINLYLVERTDRIDYDEFDASVVAAENEVEAEKESKVSGYQNLTVTLLGKAVKGTGKGDILSSYNAG